MIFTHFFWKFSPQIIPVFVNKRLIQIYKIYVFFRFGRGFLLGLRHFICVILYIYDYMLRYQCLLSMLTRFFLFRKSCVFWKQYLSIISFDVFVSTPSERVGRNYQQKHSTCPQNAVQTSTSACLYWYIAIAGVGWLVESRLIRNARHAFP